jgi:DNA-binding transcriptional MocR family regulator
MVKTLQQHAASGALRFSVPDGGLFLWCRLAANTSAAAVQRHALKENVFLVTGEPFYADGAGTQELRLCFSVNPVEASVRAATVIARSVTAAARQPARALVSRIV